MTCREAPDDDKPWPRQFIKLQRPGHKHPQAWQASPGKPLPQTKECLKMLYLPYSVSPDRHDPQHNWMIDMKTVHYLLLGVFAAAAAAAQPIYETPGKDGPVFSDLPSQGRDLPSPGATEVTLPPINLSDSPPAAPKQPAQTPAVAAHYQSLAITEPASGGTIHSNTGQIPVQLAIQPALRADQGDAIVVTLDGGALPGTYTTAQFEISASQWQAAATDSVEHQLQVSIMDRSGELLITSAPQSFYVHRATVGGRAR
jgi:hypothetical protein